MLHDDVARLFIANAAAAGLLEEGEGVRPNPTSTEYFNTVEIQ